MLFHKLKSMLAYFTKGEFALWSISVTMIVVSFFMFDRGNCLTLAASLVGVTSLIFNAKGNPFGQFLMVIFSLLYGIISYSFTYYGEMITYFRSVVAFGKVRILENDGEIREAIEKLAIKYHPKDSEENRKQAIAREWKPLCIIELSIEHMTGKEAIELTRMRSRK